jgi:hypothetical protein
MDIFIVSRDSLYCFELGHVLSFICNIVLLCVLNINEVYKCPEI